MKRLFLFLLVVTSWSCVHESKTEKHQSRRNSIINVQDRIKKIDVNNVLIGQVSVPYIFDDHLVICDLTSGDKFIHIFEKENFTYMVSAMNRGRGPGEVVRPGNIAWNPQKRRLYVSDHGKQTIFDYELDSLLVNPLYMPQIKMFMNTTHFPDKYQYINDTLAIGLSIEPIGVSDYKQSMARLSLNTGELHFMPYEHPDIEKPRFSFAVSTDHETYVVCYRHHDLMTICSLAGDLRYNIYGKEYNTKVSDEKFYYGGIAFCGDRIIASYSGQNTFSQNKVNYPTKLLVFDLNGDYLRTLETGYEIADFCCDIDNRRVILVVNEEIQFAYLDLDGLI